MPERPRISIAMCSYNGSAHLAAQLQSLAHQTRLPDELVVCDDASSDDSVKILRAFALPAPFPVSVRVNPTNVGVRQNFSQAIAACNANVIALCDQDDIWAPQKLERIEQAFIRNPGLGFVFSDAGICDENAGPLGYTLWTSVGFTPAMQRRLRSGRAFDVILRQNVVTGATMAFSSRFTSLVLPISPNWLHDGWIALLVAAVAPVEIIREPLIHYRQHATQAVGALRRSLFQQYRNAREMDRQIFAEHAAMYQTAMDRLFTVDPRALIDPQTLPKLAEKIEHFRTRSAIRMRQSSRFGPSVTELLTLRYRRYSMGWKSFAQDLFL